MSKFWDPVLIAEQLTYRYGNRLALDRFSLNIDRGQIFSFLGPNGSGKTTLFRVLSTLLPVQEGKATLCGFDLRASACEIRSRIGVIFQAPSLDKKLTVSENIRLQAALFGIRGRELKHRETELLERFGLTTRRSDRTESLSGGLRRRCELAKCLVHLPQVLLLDEPSTGLDPGARIEFWECLKQLRDTNGATIILTTHLLEEADKSDRIAIMDRGRLVAEDSPDVLRSSVGRTCVTVECYAPAELAGKIRDRFGVDAKVVDRSVRLEATQAQIWVNELWEAFPDEIRSIILAKPSLEDVFIAKTGHRLGADHPE